MNLLCKAQALQIIKDLGKIKVNGKFCRFELVCGADYRFMTQELANALFRSRFGFVGFDKHIHLNKRQIRIAWDGKYDQQKKVKKAVDMLVKAGYRPNEIMVFMQANYRLVGYAESCLKLDLCKVWNVEVCDCYYDGQIGSKIIPVFWSDSEIKLFRKKVRKHNQLVSFKIDPEVD